jgi:hypothetical protein
MRICWTGHGIGCAEKGMVQGTSTRQYQSCVLEK